MSRSAFLACAAIVVIIAVVANGTLTPEPLAAMNFYWFTPLSTFLSAAVLMFVLLSISALLSPTRWMAPDWKRNPFKSHGPILFWQLGVVVLIGWGFGVALSCFRLGAPALAFALSIFSTALGMSVGVKLFTIAFVKKFVHSDVEAAELQIESAPYRLFARIALMTVLGLIVLSAVAHLVLSASKR